MAAGDTFKLFTASGYSGSFAAFNLPPLGAGLNWTNKLLVDGSIAVVAWAGPKITSVTQSATSLIFTVIDGTPGGGCTLLTSTNVASPPTDWATNTTSNFDWAGNLTITNFINPADPQRFYSFRLP